ncbi:M23 family metallopeptidase [Caldalkalibacillus salinus]|uniref:M23 family metallopeptidase n=1 Tax=Caldalkalibacillus salinus TaxID=2803787 RepID=UPI001922E894|nr:M23 family metallopeptidase [Caldalkalibacillus salinus]
MEFENYKEGIKKRRAERLRLLRKKQRLHETSTPFQKTMSTQQDAYHTYFDYNEPEERMDHKGVLPLLFKIFISLLIVGAGYFVLESDRPELLEVQGYMTEVLQRDFNVQGVTAWMESYTGSEVTFLPQIVQRPETEPPPSDYGVPVSAGKVVSNFGQTQQGIMVGTTDSLPVEAIKEGWVTFVGEKEGLGFTIIIEHGDGEESWYAQIKDANIALHDWVQQGDVVGYTRVDEESQDGTFYFALKKDSKFIDPLDVIPFD